MSSSPPVELLGHLRNRGEILQCLAEGTADRRDIADIVEKSRSSVDRDLRLLREDQYISECGDDFTITTYGELALELFRMANQLGELKQLTPHLPQGIPFSIIKYDEVEVTGGTVPDQPIRHLCELIESSCEVKIATPVLSTPIINTIIGKIRDGSMAVEIVFTNQAFDEMVKSYNEELCFCLSNNNCKISKTNSPLSHGLVIADDEDFCLNVYDNSLRFLGIIRNDSNPIVNWASSNFSHYQDKGEEINIKNV